MLGVLGKPNVGKTTFFNAATSQSATVANFPFTTVNPNIGIANVRVSCVCKEMGVEDNPSNSKCVNGNRLIPVKLVDVAGLVSGASQGRGLGNKFLDEVRQADALIHVIDVSGSSDEEGRSCPVGSHDPAEDIEFVEKEFDTWLFGILQKDWSHMARSSESGTKKLTEALAEKLSGLRIGESEINQSIAELDLSAVKPITWSEEVLFKLCRKLREISKPSLVVANKIDISGSSENIERLKQGGKEVIPCAAEAEVVLRKASELGLIEYLPGDGDFEVHSKMTEQQEKALALVKDKVLRDFGSTGVQEAINSAYFKLLKNIVVYPVEDDKHLTDKKGRILPDAFLIPIGATVRDLAYRVHTDLGDSILYAIDVKKGTRLGVDAVLNDRDIVKIVSSARRT
ncbi:MAG: redox-regulated ATPase YchF [Nitrososphaerales archaeon]